MKSLAWTLGACAASAVIAYALGAHGSSPTSAPAATVAAAAAPRVVTERVIAPGAPGGLSRDDVRAAIREELAERAQAGTVATEPTSREDGQRMVAAAHAVVSDGLRDGVWDARDRAALRERIAHLGPDDAQDAIAPLFAAINAQRVQLEGPPL
jgi:hypothetical protein